MASDVPVSFCSTQLVATWVAIHSLHNKAAGNTSESCGFNMFRAQLQSCLGVTWHQNRWGKAVNEPTWLQQCQPCINKSWLISWGGRTIYIYINYIILYHIILYYIISYHMILYYIISYHMILYYIISYHMILHYIILY